MAFEHTCSGELTVILITI